MMKQYLDHLYQGPINEGLFNNQNFNMMQFYNNIYPLTIYNPKFDPYKAMQHLLYWCIDSPIIWRDRSRFGHNKMKVNWPKDIYFKKKANCVDLAFFANFFGKQKYIEVAIIALSITSKINTARLDHFTVLFSDSYKRSKSYYYWNYFDTGKGYLAGPYESYVEAFGSLKTLFAKDTYSPKNGFINIPKPLIDKKVLDSSDIHKLNTKIDQDITQYSLFREMPEFKKWYAKFVPIEEGGLNIMHKLKPLLWPLVERLKEHGENVNYDTDPSYLIGKNMMIVDQEYRRKLGDAGYNKLLRENYEKEKYEIYNDPDPIRRKERIEAFEETEKTLRKIFGE